MTKTAIFDAFATVVRIGRRTNPYRQLLREGIKQGRRPHSGHAHVIMTLNLELHELAEHLGIRFSEPRRVEIESALQVELNSIEAYPNVISQAWTLMHCYPFSNKPDAICQTTGASGQGHPTSSQLDG
ncbi:hypothetical protein [Pseudomonas sp. BN607]|uniref:hypothetical protein n=1 Tax=Pseudomonas sp. BN607 TaxID=2567895 RepID=UPI002455CB57|nr:hypothetical protein [Pseudomonas sp. BN607]MDH4552747.1 hypothetical protein [Pseudomonas sp. BN607]